MSEAEFGYVTPETLPLFTDLYELTMVQGYLAADHTPRATFSLFVRDLPTDRGYLLAVGLEQVVAYLEGLAFDDDALAFLAERGFGEVLLEYLADFSFSGDVRAVPEGTPVFADEPLLEVTAPLPEAQLLETLLINQVGFQTLVATKAARMTEAVERAGADASLVDFGSRRAHGTDAGLKAARAAYVGGFDGTSNVAAGEAFGLPLFGTMAHSWVQSFPSERAAFEAFVDRYGEDSILLVDTYDTATGVEIAIDVASETGIDVAGVRLDSGDLAALSRETAARLEEAGVEMDVFVSSGIDEYAIADIYDAGGVVDGFGAGTSLVTSRDAPAMDIVYKLVALEEDGELRPTMKLSTGKVTYPGGKRLTRIERDGTYREDVLAQRGEAVAGTDLLEPVFEAGDLVYDLPSLDAVRERARAERRRLPSAVRSIRDPDDYPVRVSDGLRSTSEDVRGELESDRTPGEPGA